MDIEKIKWMVGYADEFEWNKKEGDWLFKLPSGYCIYQYHFEDKFWTKSAYPHLLTRTIEGINRDNKFKILLHFKRILVWDSECGLHIPKIILELKDFKHIDEAKRAAIDYVYEQEE